MSQPARVQVLLPDEEAERFEAYCKEKGFKKSTLIVRLIREYLDKECFESQKELFSPAVKKTGEA
jgi:metal-responsive CopG/Arc/MetJ family transcriptional regulator